MKSLSIKSLSIKNLFILTFFLISAVLVSGLIGISKPNEVYAVGSTNTVTFNANGEYGNNYTQVFDNGVAENLMANQFTREHYTFVNWNTNSNGEGTSYNDGASLTIYSDITLYAQWSENIYIITLDVDGGNELADNTVEISYGDTIPTLPEPTRNGYAFIGWYYIATPIIQNVSIFTIDQNVTITAHWTILYSITFEENGGLEIENYNQAQGVTITLPMPTKEGFIFVGWYLDEDCTIPANLNIMPAENTTLYASWEAINNSDWYYIICGSLVLILGVGLIFFLTKQKKIEQKNK